MGMKLHATIQVAAMTLSLEEDILIEPWVDGWVGGWVLHSTCLCNHRSWLCNWPGLETAHMSHRLSACMQAMDGRHTLCTSPLDRGGGS